MTIDLSVDFCGVKFKHPFLLASTTASRMERWKKAARAGWAGASSWALSAVSDARGVAWMALPNEFEYIDRADENWFIQTGGHFAGIDVQKGPMPPDLVARCVRDCKKSGLPAIVNIVGSFEVEPWVKASIAAEEACISSPANPLNTLFQLFTFCMKVINIHQSHDVWCPLWCPQILLLWP